MGKLHPSERALQKAAADYLDRVLDPTRARWFHVPNGGRRNLIEAVNFKREGVKPGIPDCVLLWSFYGPLQFTGGAHCGFIELKRVGGTQSKEQRAFEAWCLENEFPYSVCRSLGEIKTALQLMGVPTRGRITA